MKQPTLTIGIGHDNAPNGQTGTGGELDLLKKVYFALAPLLQKAGIVVYYDDATVNNASFTDYAIFPHFDGSTNQGYNGGFVDCSPESFTKEKDWEFARVVADHYFSAMGISFRPEHRTNNSTYYYAFNLTGKDTICFLIELGTLTSPHDKPILQDYGKIARLLSEGIIAYLTAHDENYKAYLAGQAAVTNQTQTDELRKQLQEQKELVTKLRQDHEKALSDQKNLCYRKLQDIKAKLAEVQKLLE